MGRSRSLRIGIYFNARRDQGGLYQYALTLIHCLNTFDQDNNYILFHATLEPFQLNIDNQNWEIIHLARNILIPHLAIEAALFTAARFGWRRPLRILPRNLQIQSVPLDMMLYVKPTIHVFQWPHRSVFPIHDLQHLFQPEYPEVSAHGEGERREYIYQNSVPRAVAILTDSEVGREDVIQAYNADPARIHALPYLAPTYLAAEVSNVNITRVKAHYQLPEEFLFYPASFWSHKNHANLFRAIHLLKTSRDLQVHLVLTGSKRHKYRRLVQLSTELSLTDQIHFLGYVPDEDLYPLYRLALALVMPTFFGPTNIPILEAWALGCPVITSDVRGVREQVADAGLQVDPLSEESIAQAIWQIHTETRLRSILIQRGIQKIAKWTPRDFAQRLITILTHACMK